MRTHLLVAASLALMVSTLPLAECAPVGLLTNAGFDESPAPDQPRGWAVPRDCRDVCQVVDDEGHSGKQCLRFRIQAPREVEPAAQKLGCEPGRDYVLPAWFKAAGTLRPVVCVTLPGQRGPALAQVEAAGGERWNRQHCRFNSGVHRRFEVRVCATVAALTGGNAASGTAWVDDVQVWDAGEFARSTEAVQRAHEPRLVNIARGKPYTLEPRPNYRYSTDKGDATQLTDGTHSTGYFWVQKGTVGWDKARHPMITIDLQRIEPICGVSFNTAGGAVAAGVTWPDAIVVFTSEDGKELKYAGDLIGMSPVNGLPDPVRYAVHRYATDGLETKGRYVRIVVSTRRFVFCDEIEVHRGPDSFLAGPAQGVRVADVKAFARTERRLSTLRTPFIQDMQVVKQAVPQAGLAAGERQRLDSLLSRLDRASHARVAGRGRRRSGNPLPPRRRSTRV